MNQGTVPFINCQSLRLLVSIFVLLVSACAADEPEHVPATKTNSAQPGEEIPVREWYPTPKPQQAPYYVFAPDPGQNMQQQIITTAPAQPGQGYNAARQSWTPAQYPVQQGVPQYPVAGDWGGYGQTQVQRPVAQPQPYQPYPQYQPYQQPYQPVPQYQQPYQPVPQSQQPYQPAPQQYQPYQVQPQYQPAQRPWGVNGDSESSGRKGRQSIETWQMPNQYQGWSAPAYNGTTGQPGATQNNAVPGYYR
jgi:S-DNA-T family DNA segregation ATPase FtsK/SpoIIIE